MINKIILLITLLSYSIVASQCFMYILSLKNTQLALGGKSYIELRQLIDANMRGLFKYIVYITLLANLLLVIINLKAPSDLSFITATIAFLSLLADTSLTIKGNIPLNNLINSWSPENYPNNWKEIRAEWFNIFQYRQIAVIIGFVCLLIGVIFAR